MVTIKALNGEYRIIFSPKEILKKIQTIVHQQLTQGVTPHKLALSCALGVTLGIFPVLGSTTFLCFVMGVALRLNQPLLQFVNYLMYPLQLICIPIFLTVGQKFETVQKLEFDIPQMMNELAADPLQFIKKFGLAAIYAVFIWAIVFPVLTGAIYLATKPIFKVAYTKIKKQE